MAKVIVNVDVLNMGDLYAKRANPTQRVRRAKVEMLVDTGATRLYLQSKLVKKLGLEQIGQVSSRTAAGISVQRNQYDGVELQLMGRRGLIDVVEVPDNVPNLFGQVPLEMLDLVVNPKEQKVTFNPEHGDQLILEEYFLY